MPLQLLLARVSSTVGTLAAPWFRGNSSSRLIWARARSVRFVVAGDSAFPRSQLYILMQKRFAPSPKMVTQIGTSVCRPQPDHPESTASGGEVLQDTPGSLLANKADGLIKRAAIFLPARPETPCGAAPTWAALPWQPAIESHSALPYRRHRPLRNRVSPTLSRRERS